MISTDSVIACCTCAAFLAACFLQGDFCARKFSVFDGKSGQVIASVNKESRFASGKAFLK
jgi:hypothetical protein